jgi:O-Antigen ligase
MNSNIRPAWSPGLPRRADVLALAFAFVAGLGLLLLVAEASAPVRLQVAAGLLVVAVLVLAVARYDAAVALAFVLLGVVRFEPAPSDVILPIVIAVALVTGRFNFGRIPIAPVVLVGVLMAGGALSLAAAIDLSAGLRFLVISLYMGTVFVWLVGYVDSQRRARLIVVSYLAAALASAVLGTLPFLLSFSGADLFTTEGGFRGQALFKDANVFGAFLVPAVLILVDEIISPRLLLLPRWSKSLLVLVLAAGLLFSYSRAAWISLSVGLLVLFAVYLLRRARGRGMRLTVALLIGAVMLIGPLVAFTGAWTEIEERAKFQTYDQERFGAQREGLELGEKNPLGVGPAQFDLHAPLGAHSLYIRLFAEQGPAGFLVLLLFVALTLAVAGDNVLRGRDTFGIGSAVLLAALVGLLVTSLVVDTFHWRHLWIIAALVWVGWARRSSAVGAWSSGRPS